MKKAKRRKANTARAASSRPHAKTDPSDLCITEVALMLGIGYQRARNAMLAGRLGVASYEPNTRRLTVKRDAVVAFQHKTLDHSTVSKDSAAQRTAK